MIWVGPRVLIRGRHGGQSQRSDSERRETFGDAVFLALLMEEGAKA